MKREFILQSDVVISKELLYERSSIPDVCRLFVPISLTLVVKPLLLFCLPFCWKNIHNIIKIYLWKLKLYFPKQKKKLFIVSNNKNIFGNQFLENNKLENPYQIMTLQNIDFISISY